MAFIRGYLLLNFTLRIAVHIHKKNTILSNCNLLVICADSLAAITSHDYTVTSSHFITLSLQSKGDNTPSYGPSRQFSLEHYRFTNMLPHLKFDKISITLD